MGDASESGEQTGVMSVKKIDRNTMVPLFAVISLIVAMGGGIAWLTKSDTTQENLVKSFDEFRHTTAQATQDLSRQIAELKGYMSAQTGEAKSIQKDISSLNTRVDIMEKEGRDRETRIRILELKRTNP